MRRYTRIKKTQLLIMSDAMRNKKKKKKKKKNNNKQKHEPGRNQLAHLVRMVLSLTIYFLYCCPVNLYVDRGHLDSYCADAQAVYGFCCPHIVLLSIFRQTGISKQPRPKSNETDAASHHGLHSLPPIQQL